MDSRFSPESLANNRSEELACPLEWLRCFEQPHARPALATSIGLCRIGTPVTSHCVFPGRFPSRLIRESARFRLFSHTHAEITCQEADFLHPTEIAGSRRALPRVFASVIILDNHRRRQCGLVRAYGAENVTRN